MIKKEKFYSKNIDEAMKQAVSIFNISEEKIFLNILEENENEIYVEALVDINLLLEGKRYLESILKEFDLEYKLEAKANADETEISFNVFTSKNPLLIGHRGRVLDAIQHLIRDMLKNYTKEHILVSLDIGGFREKRKHQLEVVATKVAKEVAKTKVAVKLDPMNSFERRIIHAKLSDWRDVETQSEGQGENRAIVIKCKTA